MNLWLDETIALLYCSLTWLLLVSKTYEGLIVVSFHGHRPYFMIIWDQNSLLHVQDRFISWGGGVKYHTYSDFKYLSGFEKLTKKYFRKYLGFIFGKGIGTLNEAGGDLSQCFKGFLKISYITKYSYSAILKSCYRIKLLWNKSILLQDTVSISFSTYYRQGNKIRYCDNWIFSIWNWHSHFNLFFQKCIAGYSYCNPSYYFWAKFEIVLFRFWNIASRREL